MTTPASRPPGVYHSRSRVTRNRLALAAAGLALVLLGYLIGRLQDSPDTPAVPAPFSEPAVPSAAPSSAPAPAAPGGIDAYSVVQAETAAGREGTEVEDTGDEGGGQNAAWINNGDWLRFDDVDFGEPGAGTGGWQDYQTRMTTIQPTTGRHTGFLTFGRDGNGEFLNLNHFTFAR